MILLLLPLWLLAGQVYWIGRACTVLGRLVPARTRPLAQSAFVSLCMAVLLYNWDRLFELPHFGPQSNPINLSTPEVLLAATQSWLICSAVAFLLALPLAIGRTLVRSLARMIRKLRSRRIQEEARPLPSDRPRLPERRHFLEYTADAALAVPFVAGGYGLLRGRVEMEVTRHQIRSPRLPRSFAGFRIVQLSDFHISGFMNEDQIRHYAGVAASLGAQLIVLTGDFVSWDPAGQYAVVRALAGLRAPFGVFGCLGNHEAWSGASDSIASLFARVGIHILRDSSIRIADSGDTLNVIGIEPIHGWSQPFFLPDLRSQGAFNVLLSHYPTVFDAAADLGVDFMLAGHTHGGQVKLDYFCPKLVPALLKSPYVAGWFKKGESQLYVNRGIGTVGVPIRLGMPPEIAVFDLTR